MRVDRIDVNTGQRTQWRTFSVPDSAGVIVFRMAMTPDGRSYAYNYLRRLDTLYLVEGLK